MDTKTWLERITEHSGMERDEVIEAGKYGADAGWPGFTYTTDAAAFTAKHRSDIWEMLSEDADEYGHKSVLEFVGSFTRADMADTPDGLDNLLAWYVLESVGHALESEDDEA
jgi:hypothetical protein